MRQKSKWFKILLIVFSSLFVISSVMVIRLLGQARREEQTFDDLETIAAVAPPPDLEEGTYNGKEQEEYVSPYLSLKEENPDFYGWITIEDTKVDYPVMFTPDEPEYYLRRDFYGKSSLSGVPFLDASCTEDGGNALIYGHNMNNGTMFAAILSYAEETYWREHPVIQFDTLDGSGSYEVMGAFYSQAYERDRSEVFRYYQYTDLSRPEVFEEYVRQVRAAALYETGVEASYGDQLITLSTCSYHVKNGRFVVVARKADTG